MSKPIIAVDFDDVICEFNRCYAEHHNQEYGTSVQYKDIWSFDMPTIWNLDIKIINTRVRWFCHQRHHTITVCPEAASVLPRLAQTHELHIVTSRCESLCDITTAWLQSNQLNVFSKLHFTNGLGSLHPDRKRSKLSVCHEIGALCLIEDAAANAEATAEGGVPVLLPDRPWNRLTRKHELITRAAGWTHIEQIVLGHYS